MARDEEIERRLLNWARWKAGIGGGGLGHARSRWAEDASFGGRRYREAVIPTDACDADETDRAVRSLDAPLRRTLEVVYVDDLGGLKAAATLCVAEATVKARVWQAHRLLGQWFRERRRQADEQRARVDRLQRSSAH